MNAKLTNLKAIGFDLDNTLYSRDQAVNRWIRSVFGDDEATANAGIAYDNSGFIPRPDFYSWIAERVDWAEGWKDAEARFQREVMSMIEIDTAIHEAVERLGKRYKLGILTNGDSGFQLKKFSSLGIDRHFDSSHVFATGDIGHHKPDQRAFQPLIDSFGLVPEDVLFVGDNPENDIEGAAALGMKTCWIQLFPEHSCGIEPDLTIDSVAQLPALLPDQSTSLSADPANRQGSVEEERE